MPTAKAVAALVLREEQTEVYLASHKSHPPMHGLERTPVLGPARIRLRHRSSVAAQGVVAVSYVLRERPLKMQQHGHRQQKY